MVSCGECEKALRSTVYWYGDTAFCSKTHARKWLQRRALGMMLKEAKTDAQRSLVRFIMEA